MNEDDRGDGVAGSVREEKKKGKGANKEAKRSSGVSLISFFTPVAEADTSHKVRRGVGPLEDERRRFGLLRSGLPRGGCKAGRAVLREVGAFAVHGGSGHRLAGHRGESGGGRERKVLKEVSKS